MLNKLKDLAENARNIGNAMQFDPSKFDDPLAMQVEWNRIGRTNTNFKARNLNEVSPGRLEYKSSKGAMAFSLIFIVVGLIIPVWFFISQFNSAEVGVELLFPLLFGGLFIGVGYFLLKSKTKPIVFDKNSGHFWTGKEDPGTGMNNQNAVRLSDVHAVQQISQFVRGDKRSYYVYETNLVLKDANRVHVTGQGGSRQSSMQDAQQIANFIGVPLWSAV